MITAGVHQSIATGATSKRLCQHMCMRATFNTTTRSRHLDNILCTAAMRCSEKVELLVAAAIGLKHAQHAQAAAQLPQH